MLMDAFTIKLWQKDQFSAITFDGFVIWLMIKKFDHFDHRNFISCQIDHFFQINL